MPDRTPICKAALLEILRREFQRLKAPACTDCKVGPPVPIENRGWTCEVPACEYGCHRALQWMVAQYSMQYRLRDACDTQC